MTIGGRQDLRAAVGDAIRDAAQRAIMPRFKVLQEHEVSTKAEPGDLVTSADLEAEALITERLLGLRPDVPVLGEESCSADPELRDRLLSSGTFWTVDPLDGTKGFVAGEPWFGVMVALVEDGETTAGWIYLPPQDVLYDGVLGDAVRRNGDLVRLPASRSTTTGFALTRLAPPDVRAAVDGAMENIPPVAVEGLGCAAVAYSHLLDGRLGFGFYWRTEPWDHAPGSFLLSLNGGRAARLDGRSYRPAEAGAGLLATGRTDDWTDLRAMLLGSR